MAQRPFTIGAFGLGCVGQGFVELLEASGGHAAHLKHVCIKEPGRIRHAPGALFTHDALDILTDAHVQAIVELTNDPALALRVITQALSSGRDAITASKKVVAEHLPELIALQRRTGRALLYEAACAASIPVVHALETHFSGEHVLRVQGILNGTTNHILTRMEDGLSLADALREAQAAGFAEADPTSDLSGDDARYKLVILIAHAFGTLVRPREVLRHGIEALEEADVRFGAEQGWVVRSLATAQVVDGALSAHVLPTFVPHAGPFAQVRGEYNAVRITGTYSGEHVLQGKGAGKLPTGLAVLSDVQQLARGGGYAYAKVNGDAPLLSDGAERIAVYARLPGTHRELLARFDTVRPLSTTSGAVRVTGTLALDDLTALLGEGREGFQVIALPHLSA